jgi:hypothetical protein
MRASGFMGMPCYFERQPVSRFKRISADCAVIAESSALQNLQSGYGRVQAEEGNRAAGQGFP